MSGFTQEIWHLRGHRPVRSIAFPYGPEPGAIDISGHELGRSRKSRSVAG